MGKDQVIFCASLVVKAVALRTWFPVGTLDSGLRTAISGVGWVHASVWWDVGLGLWFPYSGSGWVLPSVWWDLGLWASDSGIGWVHFPVWLDMGLWTPDSDFGFRIRPAPRPPDPDNPRTSKPSVMYPM